jgi:hypothetical protein
MKILPVRLIDDNAGRWLPQSGHASIRIASTISNTGLTNKVKTTTIKIIRATEKNCGRSFPFQLRS